MQREEQAEFKLLDGSEGRRTPCIFPKMKKSGKNLNELRLRSAAKQNEEAKGIVEEPQAYMIDDSVWLRVPEMNNTCFVSGLKGREILKLMPHNSRSYRMGVTMLVRFRHVSLGAKQDWTTCLVNKDDLMRFINFGGVQCPPPKRFARYLKAYPYKQMTQVTDNEYIILAGPYGIGEEETLSEELERMTGKAGIELGYNRKSVNIIQRRRS